MQNFYVLQNGKTIGPWGEDKIQQAIHSGDLNISDFFYNPEKQAWEMIGESQWFLQRFGLKTDSSRESIQGRVWYVFKAGQKLGPLSYLEIVALLQRKQVVEFDYVWRPGLETWVKLHNCSDFSQDRIKNLLVELGSLEQVFVRRRYPRVPLNERVYVHDHRRVWRLTLVEVSAGGVGLEVFPDMQWEVGKNLILHFPRSPHVLLPPFNALCEVVSDRFSLKEGRKVGLKFKAINQDIQNHILQFTEQGCQRAS